MSGLFALSESIPVFVTPHTQELGFGGAVVGEKGAGTWYEDSTAAFVRCLVYQFRQNTHCLGFGDVTILKIESSPRSLLAPEASRVRRQVRGSSLHIVLRLANVRTPFVNDRNWVRASLQENIVSALDDAVHLV
jgi:hypothetical protein